MSVRISVTSKLDGIRSWSLQAIDTCPGSIASPGELVDACKGCYATTGNYNYPNVKAPRLHNRDDWQRLEWVDDMVQALEDAAKPEPLWLSILGAVLVTVALACLFMSAFQLWSA